MSGKPEPVALVGSLAAASVPAARLRAKTSLPRLRASPGSRLKVPAGASKATTRPSALIAGRSVVPLACTPAVVRAASAVVPAATSRTTTSDALLPSPANRLVARPLVKATASPVYETSGSPPTAALAFSPAELTEMIVTAPVVRSLRKTSLLASASPGERLVATEANTA